MAYSNGLIPDSALVTIDRGARLLPGPAKSFTWICDEVERRYGWRPRPTGSFDGFRPLSGNYYAQTETFLRRYTRQALGSGPYGDVRFWNGVRYVRTNGAAAAVPGTSNHGWACAVDVASLMSFTSERYRQFAEVAAEAGWSNVEGRSIGEYWHWVDPSSVALVKAGQSTTGTIPDIPNQIRPTPPREWDEMASKEEIAEVTTAAVQAGVAQILAAIKQDSALIYRSAAGQIVLVNGDGVKTLTPGEWQTLRNLGHTITRDNLSPGPFAALVSAHGGLK